MKGLTDYQPSCYFRLCNLGICDKILGFLKKEREDTVSDAARLDSS